MVPNTSEEALVKIMGINIQEEILIVTFTMFIRTIASTGVVGSQESSSKST